MVSNEKFGSIDVKQLKSDADSFKSGLGAVAWAILEVFKRGGIPVEEIEEIKGKMNRYFQRRLLPRETPGNIDLEKRGTPQ